VENPWASWVWSVDEMQALSGSPRSQNVKCHYRQSAASWVKPTRLQLWRMPDATELMKVCSPKRIGGYSLRSFSREPHQVLCGLATKKGSRGAWVTEQANRYFADLRTLGLWQVSRWRCAPGAHALACWGRVHAGERSMRSVHFAALTSLCEGML
jgi:hypothetical protein